MLVQLSKSGNCENVLWKQSTDHKYDPEIFIKIFFKVYTQGRRTIKKKGKKSSAHLIPHPPFDNKTD